MKRFKYITNFLSLSTVIILLGCSSDDGPSNRVPEQAVLISPADQSEGVDIENTDLQWQQVADPDGDVVSYDVYLDSVNPPLEAVATALNTTSYSITVPLGYETPYYWNVVAKDGSGGESQSGVGMFTTREAYPDELIVGKWFINEQIVNGMPDTITDCNKTSYFEFEANGTLSVVTYDGDPCVISSSTILQYSVPDAMTLVLSNGGTTESVPIISLTETELKIMLETTTQYNLIKED
ncbi:hypothetical protein Murru_1472 [Allomuricauda ruestringensis DSM 13258]|uniref:Lipocalin-like domain-containing protein n=1 Tax=Allomuricauda ruestringensis (strain DSM 13258 / CIP 107369 / LMG 19739 / B1) TaxID=886377 RepID=G2PQ48_ALLRU|nr:lipocalin family protein [Allomuricauda ruestringensis]AEM70513.1 hypothetical protein Murru_1472 [Allomuricauda ruestringensis DSM 13258]